MNNQKSIDTLLDVDVNKLQKQILDGVKDLDRNDYMDICQLIKYKTNNYSMIKTTEKGTYIDLDKLDLELLSELYSMIHTKLQRIKSE
jgi:hypothetical protein